MKTDWKVGDRFILVDNSECPTNCEGEILGIELSQDKHIKYKVILINPWEKEKDIYTILYHDQMIPIDIIES